MSEGHVVALAVLAVGLAFPAAGVSKTTGGTLNMIAWEGYTAAPVGEAVREAVGLHVARQVRRLLRRDGRR